MEFCSGKHHFCQECWGDWVKDSICRKLAGYRMGREDEIDIGLRNTWITCPVCRADLLDARSEIDSFTGTVEYIDETLIHLRYQDTYLNGKLHGVARSWYGGNGSGTIHSEESFVEGRREGPWMVWYKNGQKRSETTYLEGKKEGVCRVWYKSGKKMAEFPYHQGKMHGIYRRWFESGHLEDEGEYVMSERRGIFRTWNEEGELVEET